MRVALLSLSLSFSLLAACSHPASTEEPPAAGPAETATRPAEPAATTTASPSSAVAVDERTGVEDDGFEEDLATLRGGSPATKRAPTFEGRGCPVPDALDRLPEAEWDALLSDPLLSGAVRFTKWTDAASSDDEAEPRARSSCANRVLGTFPFAAVSAGASGDDVGGSDDCRFLVVLGGGGGTVIQDRNGLELVRTAASEVVLAASAAYALAVPTKSSKGTTRAFVKIPIGFRGAAHEVSAIPADVDVPDVAVDICRNGRTYAIATPGRGLAILDAADDRIAATATDIPASASVAFSRSGHLLAVSVDGEIEALYRLEGDRPKH